MEPITHRRIDRAHGEQPLELVGLEPKALERIEERLEPGDDEEAFACFGRENALERRARVASPCVHERGGCEERIEAERQRARRE